MAVVWRKVYEDGGIAEIADDAYRDITPEEHARRMGELSLIVSGLLGVACEAAFSKKAFSNETPTACERAQPPCCQPENITI